MELILKTNLEELKPLTSRASELVKELEEILGKLKEFDIKLNFS